MYLIFVLGLVKIDFATAFNDFPSLMIANASMAVVIERPFFEMKAVKKRHTVRNAYEKKVEGFVKTITEAAKARGSDSNVGMEINVFQETSVNLARDYTVLLSVASCHETWNLFKRARKEKLVHLAITDRDCPRLPSAYGISIPIVEPSQELPQMLLDLRVDRVISWTKINILHDHIFERDSIGEVFRALFGEIPNIPRLGLSSQCFFSTESSNHSLSMKKQRIIETLQKFPHRRFSVDRFLVIVSIDIVTTVIESARSLGMLHPESQWLFVLSDSAENPSNVTELKKLLAEGENIAFIYNVTNFDEDCRVGLECHAKEMVSSLTAGLENALRQEVELYEKISDEEFDAVRMTKAERCQQLIAFVRDDLYNPDGEKGRRRKCDDCVMWKMLAGITWGNSFNRKNKSEDHQLIDAGFWTPGQGSAPKELLFPHSEYGFRNKALPIVTYHNPPWQYISKSMETGELKWDGLVFDIVNELSKKLNFTCKLVESGTKTIEREKHSDNLNRLKNHTDTRTKNEDFIRTSTSSGERIPNDVTDLVHSGQVFMAACASTITENLKSSVNFTVPISVQTYGLLAPRPKPLSRVMLFASPYTIESWACLAGAVLSVGPILYLVHEYSPSNLNGPQSVQFGLSTPAKCLWYIYGALLQQGGLHIPENDGTRLIVGTWWLVVMVVVATYSGSLVAFLTFPRMDESISTVDDIFKHKERLTWSLPAKSFLVDYLTSGKSGPYDGLLGDEEHQPERHDASNYETMINRVKEGTHVLVDWTSSLRMLMRIDNPLTNDGVCHFSIGTEAFVEESIALLLPSESPYLSLVNTELKRMKESGLIEKWTKDRMPMKDECWEGSSLNNEVNNHKVDVWDMQGIFFVLFLVTSSAKSSSVPLTDHQLHRHQSQQGLYYSPVRWTKSPQNSRQARPVDVMTDVINDLGVKILDRYLDNTGNVAFSPSGLGFVLVALYEGAAGSSSREISDVLGLPRDRRVVRIGLRDIHRRLRSYLNADAFLGGLTLNRDDINLRPDYEETLRFYGFDISDSGAENSSMSDDISTNSTDSPLTLTTTMNPDLNSTTSTVDPTSDNSTATTGFNDAAEVVTNVTGDPSSAMSMGTNASLSTTPINLTTSTMTNSVTNMTNTTDVTTLTNLTATTPMSTASTTPGTISSTESSTSLANIQTVSNSSSSSSSSSSTNTSSTIMPMSSLVGTSTELANTQTQSSNGSITTPMTSTLTTIINSTPTSSTTTVSNGSVSTGSTSTSTRNSNDTNANSTTTVTDNPTTSILEDTATNVVRKRRGLLHRPDGYFSSTADDGIWLDEYGRFNNNHEDYQSQKDDIAVDPRRETEIAFLVNGCDLSRVTGAVYTAFLPFSYFPSLRASLLEFPLDDPRYKILIMLPSDENGTRRLARTLVTKTITLRNLRRSLQSAWVTAVVPSFMLRGFVTLTPYLERLGISDVFDPRAADLTPMSPDLGVYARDIQQSIGVNIRNNVKGGIGGADGGSEDQKQLTQQRDDLVRRVRGIHGVLPFFLAGGAISPRPPGHPPPHYPVYPGAGTLYERAPPVPFVVDRPFLYFIIDDETSVTLLAGRIDDPLNSRML